MSKSVRRPYTYICGAVGYLKEDRQLASRGVRRKQNQYIRTFDTLLDPEYDSFLVPDKYECHGNERWGWKCDSDRARYQSPHYSRYELTYAGLIANGCVWDSHSWSKYEEERARRYYDEVISGKPSNIWACRK